LFGIASVLEGQSAGKPAVNHRPTTREAAGPLAAFGPAIAGFESWPPRRQARDSSGGTRQTIALSPGEEKSGKSAAPIKASSSSRPKSRNGEDVKRTRPTLLSGP